MESVTLKSKARTAGLLYFILAVTGIVGILYIPGLIIETSDVHKTAMNIRENELLFRLGIVSNLIGQTVFVFLAFALYRLFRDVNKYHAQVLVGLVIVSVPISFVSIAYQFAAINLVSGQEYLSVLSETHREAQAMFYLDFYNQGIAVVEIFWGLWLFPFGYLVYKSGFLPKILGILLMIGCFGYLIESFTAMVFPNYSGPITTIAMIPATAGEMGTMLWMLIVGAKKSKNASDI